MITSFKHKGLQHFYEKGDATGLDKRYLEKIEMILSALDAITEEKDILALRKNVHKLKGNYTDFWAISVTKKLRIIFKFIKPNILEINLVDYH